MKKIIIFGLAMFLLSGCGLGTVQRERFESEIDVNEGERARVKIGDTELVAEFNRSSERKNRGGATYIYPPDTEGVLYDLGGEVITSFTAQLLDKGADFIWIGREYDNEQMMVVGINKNVRPGIDDATGFERLYGVDRPAYYMLEVRNGWVWDHRVRIADPVELELPEATESAETIEGVDVFEGEAGESVE